MNATSDIGPVSRSRALFSAITTRHAATPEKLLAENLQHPAMKRLSCQRATSARISS